MMVRIAFFDKNTPLELETSTGKKKICQCGLSSTFPFCDGSHDQTKNEEEHKVYQYMHGERVIIGEMGGCGGHCSEFGCSSCNHEEEEEE